MKSTARQVAERFPNLHETYIGPPPGAHSSVCHPQYTVAYYDDNSILITARGHAPIVLDEERTYFRDAVEHLARCLGVFSQESRAAMVQGMAARLPQNEAGPIWIGGVCWNLDGSFAAI